jgi:trk system potassium uptake protein TrkA
MGAELAYQLFQQDHQVVVVDQSPTALQNLHPDFRGRVVEGDGLAQDVLHRAGIAEAEALAAMTNSDSLNAVVAYVASTVYGVSRVVVRNYDARWQSLQEAFGLPVVSSTLWGTRYVKALLQDTGLRLLYSLGHGEVNLYELVMPESGQGRSIAELCPTRQCQVVSLTRAGQTLLPAADLRFVAGDIVYLSATVEGAAALQAGLELLGN